MFSKKLLNFNVFSLFSKETAGAPLRAFLSSSHEEISPEHTAKIRKIAFKRLEEADLLPDDFGSLRHKARLASARVFYNPDVFGNPHLHPTSRRLLRRTITDVAAIDVGGGRMGETQEGETFLNTSSELAANQSSQVGGLSAEERIIARHKIIASKTLISRFGGYPASMLIQHLKNKKPAYVFTQAGMQLENPDLDYSVFFIDPFNKPEEHKNLMDALLTDSFDHKSYALIRTGIRYLVRSPLNAKFGTSFFSGSAVILDKKRYYQEQLNDFKLLFASVESMVDNDKPIYLKLPFKGMGNFAKINGVYDIKLSLVSAYMAALREVIASGDYKKIKVIEIPVFNEELRDFFEFFEIEKDFEENGIRFVFTNRKDILNFDDEMTDKYNLCILNPGDVNSLPGNEIGLSKNSPNSVESAIGNNTDIRDTQNWALNPHLLDPANWIGIDIKSGKRITKPLDEVALVESPSEALRDSLLKRL